VPAFGTKRSPDARGAERAVGRQLDRDLIDHALSKALVRAEAMIDTYSV
jgi:hypothetical protein